MVTLVIDGIFDRSTAATFCYCLSALSPMHGTCGGMVIEIVGTTSFFLNVLVVEMSGSMVVSNLINLHLVIVFNHIILLQFSGFEVARGFRGGSRLSRKPYGEYLKQNSVELKVPQRAISKATDIEYLHFLNLKPTWPMSKAAWKWIPGCGGGGSRVAQPINHWGSLGFTGVSVTTAICQKAEEARIM